MNDYISREDVKKLLWERISLATFMRRGIPNVVKSLSFITEQLEKIPAADVRPVVRGEWTDHRTNEHDGEWYCTACGKEITIYMGVDRKDRYAFCPNCGAKMGGEPNG